MTRALLRSLALAAASFGLLAQNAQPPAAPPPSFTAEEVGITEKLGQTVPLDLQLKDEDGKTVTLGSLLGKPTVLSLNYFRCAGICTPQLNGMAEVFNRTQAIPGQDFQVVTVSFDPRDTPEVAAQKRTNYLREISRPFPPSAWRFMTGEGAATKALADAVGFKFKPEGEEFIHAGALIILSPKGMVSRYMYGVTYLPADLQMALQEAAQEQSRPTINKWLKFCFSYDPEGRKYVLSFNKIAATLTLLAAAAFVLVLVFRGRKGKKEGKG